MKLIISTMKNEAPFLLEWIAYHQVIGFDNFLIYTNDCTDGTDFMLQRLTELGHVVHRPNKVLRRGPHKSALKYAFDFPLVEEADWIYVTDADEYLNVQAGDGMVDDLIATYPDADAIPITWRMFSCNEVTAFPFGSTLESFTDAEPEVLQERNKRRFVKSMFRNDERVRKFGLHAPEYHPEVAAEINWGSEFIQRVPEGEPRRPFDAYGYNAAQVNHYAVRSVDAYLLKRDRGRANHVGETLGTEYWDRWNKGGIEDKTIQRHLAATNARMEELRQDPELAFLERAALAISEKRVAELKKQPEYAEMRAKLVSDFAPEKPPTSGLSPVMQGNAELSVKSPRRHQNRQKFLGRMPKGGRCAEIGVWQGTFSIEILNITEPKELVLIDPWGLLAESSSKDWTHSKNEDAVLMDQMYDNVVAEYGSRDEVTIRKGFSAEVLSDYPDGYFDWVYIDGNHLYDFVKKDILISAQKVRNGGIISGDDYLWKKNGRQHVKEAVHDAMEELGLDKSNFSKQGQQFMIQI